jgi:hypothetical protein
MPRAPTFWLERRSGCETLLYVDVTPEVFVIASGADESSLAVNDIVACAGTSVIAIQKPFLR